MEVVWLENLLGPIDFSLIIASKTQFYFLEMHVSNLDEVRHTFNFGSNDFEPNGFGPYEIDPCKTRLKY